MTCIIGIVDKENGNVIIGGDSASSNGSNVFIRRDEKVFRNGDFIIGGTTSFRMLQLLRYSFKPPAVTKDIYEYMCTDFINEVRKCFNEGGYLERKSKGSELGGNFLVGYRNRLFKVEDDFQIAENLSGIDAVGCGADFALGAIHAMWSLNISPRNMILKALEVSEFLALGVKGPFVTATTNDFQLR